MPLTSPPRVLAYFSVSLRPTDTNQATGQRRGTAELAEKTTANMNFGRVLRYQAPELDPQYVQIGNGQLFPYEQFRQYNVPEASYFALGDVEADWRLYVGTNVTITVTEVYTQPDPDVTAIADPTNMETKMTDTNIGVLYRAESDEINLGGAVEVGTLFRQKCPAAAKQNNDDEVIEQWRLADWFVERNGVDLYAGRRELFNLGGTPTKVIA